MGKQDMISEQEQLLLDIRNLSVDYKVPGGYQSAVHDVSLQLRRGEILTVVGESGCGKSTIAYALLRLLDIFDKSQRISGQALYKGQDLLKMSQQEMEKIRGREIGMVFQNPLDSLNPVYRSGRQVYEAIALDRLDKREAWQRVLELYQDVRIPNAEKHMRSFPHELSGGMRQRVMIAMMLSRQPQLLVADEPTTALDVTIEAQILDILRELKDEHQTSIMIITHNFGIVAELADRICVMYAGEMVEYGDVLQIFDRPSHPYTQALLSSLPRIAKGAGRLKTIDGSVPRVVGAFVGCRFANRCPYVKAICREQAPPMLELEGEHFCRCHREVSI